MGNRRKKNNVAIARRCEGLIEEIKPDAVVVLIPLSVSAIPSANLQPGKGGVCGGKSHRVRFLVVRSSLISHPVVIIALPPGKDRSRSNRKHDPHIPIIPPISTANKYISPSPSLSSSSSGFPCPFPFPLPYPTLPYDLNPHQQANILLLRLAHIFPLDLLGRE